MKRRRTLAALVVSLCFSLFAVAQFVNRPAFAPPAPDGAAIQAHVAVPPAIDSLLRRSCYDCHSAETKWPLYARVAPVSWLIARDVVQGRSDLDFSDWKTDSTLEPTPQQRLGGICSDLRKGIMPPSAYRFMHRNAVVSASEVDAICAWTETARRQLAAPDGG